MIIAIYIHYDFFYYKILFIKFIVIPVIISDNPKHNKPKMICFFDIYP